MCVSMYVCMCIYMCYFRKPLHAPSQSVIPCQERTITLTSSTLGYIYFQRDIETDHFYTL